MTRRHSYNEDDMCLDCCMPRYLAVDYNAPECPVTDSTLVTYVSMFYPLYEARKQDMAAVAEIVSDYFG